MEQVWVEKYRPRNLGEVVDQVDIVSRLHAYVKTGSLPHLLFAGPAGTGKTTSAIALARELFGEDWRTNFAQTNASDSRGIDVIRTTIKNQARMAPIGEGGFKIIFLDEADHLTNDAQAALRRTMELYTRTARFILSVNYSSRIIPPIQSRTAVFRFRPLKPEHVQEYMTRIAKAEGLKVTSEGMDALVYVAQGDLRKATNALQVAAAVSSKIDADSLYRAASAARPEAVKKLVETALTGDFLGARTMLDDLLLEYGLAAEDLLREIYRAVYDLSVPDRVKVEMVDRVGEADYRLIQGSNDRIQLEALLSRFALLGKDLG
ncbi:MAG: replication factor C small subunit [Thermoplasmata archaeon]